MSQIEKLLEQIIERFEESDRETGDKGDKLKEVKLRIGRRQKK